ncbi:MAG: hypothetical protein AAGG44_02025 [Planctomycetota bacterium]
MRKLFFCLGVAILCSSTSSLFAQVQLLNRGPTPAPRLTASQAEVEDSLPFVPETPPSIANPFDFQTSTELAPALQAPAVPSQVGQAQAGDPTSLPVGIRHRHRRNAVVDTMSNLGSIASVPHAATTQIDWCYGSTKTPNPVADVLLHQECVEGLWDRYPAQRAAECAHMWSKLTASKGCHRCQHGGCGSKCDSGCASQPVNRYRTNSSCDTCAHCAANANAEKRKVAAQMASVETGIAK